MKICTLAAAVALTGCAAATGGASRTVPTPCPAGVQIPGGAPWRLVRGDGFTFCVPPSWRPAGPVPSPGADAQVWRGGDGTLHWSPGPLRTSTRTVTVMRREGDPLPRSETRRFSEVIDGSPAELWSNRYGEKRFTGAEWTRPRPVHFTGESESAATAALQLDVYRTVRFTRP
ncbi:MAG TPA: hypothetical protein VHG28_23245 [Longimicrobiaceae bacterium]|nr:hypothetical protein [Longimicrobiaceae bacterium]